MSLRIIYGRAGTGKSKFCLDEIKQKAKNQEQKIYIIVPEQFSYATEKRLLETIDSKSTVNVEVISFKRLAYRVNKEIGNQKTSLTKAGKAMIIKNIINKNKKNLNFIGKSNDIDLITRTITELKKHNVESIKISEQIDKTEDNLLKLKLEDIQKIYSDYQKTIKDSYIDEEDMLTILAKQLSKTNILDNSFVYIDEFSGFIPQEYKIIEEILKKAKMLTITICTDELCSNKLPENDVFYENKQTIKKIIKHAKNIGAKIEKEVFLEKTHRFKSKELDFLEKNIYSIKNEIYNNNLENIHLNLYSNPYEEVEQTAKTIINLVRTKEIRFKDISIIVKNLEDYTSIVYAIFSKYNIPIFIDSKKELNDNILIKYVLSLFDIYAKNWSKETVITYLKTGFLDISKADMYKIENYCNKWQIRGNKWYKEDWKYDLLNKDLELLNDLRKKITEPLIDFNNEVKANKTVQEITKKLYKFLEEQKIKEKLEEKIDKFESEDLKNEYISSYNILIDLLDEINLIFGTQKMTFEEYREVLKQGLETSKFGEIPEMIDSVCIGDVDRTRSHKVNAIFIFGLNDGVFPSVNTDEGFLNDDDREKLKQSGLEIAKGTLENLYDEQFNIYKAFTTAENEVYLSYVSSDKEGKAKRPSILITKIKKFFPLLKEESDSLNQDKVVSVRRSQF